MNQLFRSVRAWALVAVALIGLTLSGFAGWLIIELSKPDWCSRVMAVANEADRPESAVTGCFSLMTRQLTALSLNSHLAIGSLALCLLVLVVIVLAGGEISGTVGPKGASLSVGKDVPSPEPVPEDEDESAAPRAPRTAAPRPRRGFSDEEVGRYRPDDPDGDC